MASAAPSVLLTSIGAVADRSVPVARRLRTLGLSPSESLLASTFDEVSSFFAVASFVEVAVDASSFAISSAFGTTTLAVAVSETSAFAVVSTFGATVAGVSAFAVVSVFGVAVSALVSAALASPLPANAKLSPNPKKTDATPTLYFLKENR